MVKVFVNRKPVLGPWGGGNNFVSALFQFSKECDVEITYDPKDKFDAILMIDPRYDEIGISANEIADYKKNHPKCPVLYRVNECDARKGTKEINDIIRNMNTFLDEYIFVSNWIYDYFCGNRKIENKILKPKKSSVIYNGVNKDHFFENTDKPKSEKLRIVTHHWSNNELKGFDIYEKLDKICKDENIQFTYVGRDRGTFNNTIVIPPLSGKELGDSIRDHDLYLSASRWDPGPNHLIECVASGLPVLSHIDGGGALEFSGSNNAFYEFDDLMYRIKNNMFNKSPIIFDDWKSCIEKYCNTIKDHCGR